MHTLAIRLIATITALAFVLLVSGCGSSLFQSKNQKTAGGSTNQKQYDPDTVEYKPLKSKTRKARAKLYKPTTAISLEIPPDLVTTTDPTVLDNLEKDRQNDIRVLPEVVGARIVNRDGIYGLEVDTSVESAWKTVTQFWALSNVDLVEYNPEAGTMETDWIQEAEVEDEDASYVSKLGRDILTSLTKSNTLLDKYRIRFERLSPDQAHLHVTHRSSVRKEVRSQNQRKVSDFEWVELSTDQNRIADFLQNLILIFDHPSSS